MDVVISQKKLNVHNEGGDDHEEAFHENVEMMQLKSVNLKNSEISKGSLAFSLGFDPIRKASKDDYVQTELEDEKIGN